MQELIKKFFTLFLLIFLVFIFSCNRENKYKTFYIPDEPKDKISLDEMDHDLELMKLFFTDCYIGYYDAVENGFNLDDALEKIRQKTLLKHKNNSSIATKEFYRIICSVLSETLNVYDKHFYISFGDSVFRPKNTKKVFFSDIYLSEYDGKWVVQNNSISEIPKGSIYTGKIENLYQTYEDNVFRYGVCSSSSLSKAAIQIDGENIQVQVHSDNLQYSRPEIKFFETEKTIYISANSWFLDNEQEKEFEKICESLQTNSGKNIIIDVRNNYGGRTVFPEKLILSSLGIREQTEKEILSDYIYRVSGMYKYIYSKTKYFYDAAISNDPNYETIFKNNSPELYKTIMKSKGYFFALPPEKYLTEDFQKPTINSDFSGNIFLLINSGTMSAGEFTILYGEILCPEKIKILGTNTAGCIKYANPCEYYLENSGICFYLSQAKNCAIKSSDEFSEKFVNDKSKWQGETFGFYPDYWVLDDNLADAVSYLTEDSELLHLIF